MSIPAPRRALIALIALCLVALSGIRQVQAAPEVVYVAVGRAYLRKGPGVNFSQASLVSEGARLEITGSRGDWLKVVTTLGVEGWILDRATTTTPPPEVVIRELEQKISTLETTNAGLEDRIRILADTRQDVELAASQARAETTTLTSRIDAMESDRSFRWACLGVVVLLLGWGLGFFTGMSRRQLEARHQEQMVQATRQRMS